MKLIKSLFFTTLICTTLSSCVFPIQKQNKDTNPSITSITLDVETLTLDYYSSYSYQFTASVSGKNNASTDVVWSTSDKDTLVVTDGFAVAVAPGEATVYATSVQDSSKVASCLVTINDSTPVITGVNLNKKSLALDLYSRKTFQLQATLVGEEVPENPILTWNSTNEDVCTVDDTGYVTALTTGKATISVTPFRNEKYATKCSITVTDSTPVVSGMTLSKQEVSMVVGDTFTLKATVSGTNNPPQNVYWDVDDKTIASVSSTGLITALAIGETTVKATSEYDESWSATCKIKVGSPDEIEPTALNYTYDDYTKYNYFSLSNYPNKGKSKMLVIPVWFKDSTTYLSEDKKANIRNDINTTFFGTKEQTGWHSLKTYYETESRGNKEIEGVTSDWYTSTYKISELNSSDSSNVIVNDATNWYFTNNPTDSRKNYDSNGDGFIDAVVCVYAAPNKQNCGIDKDALWAYTIWYQSYSANKTNPTLNVYFWGSYDFMYGSNTAYSRTGKNYAGGDTRYCNLDPHCYIHEMGHVLGLPDYYDYSGSYSPAAGFSMQDYNVGSHDPYSIMAMGWTKPYIPSQSATLRIRPFQESGDLILLSNKGYGVDSPFDEYFLLEYYTPTGLNEFDTDNSYRYGYPSGTKDVGIRLWHVDARLYSFSKDQWTTNPTIDGVYHAMSNSYGNANNVSYLGSNYVNYNILQLIRADSGHNYKPTAQFNSNNLFKNGSSFSITGNNYKNQFYQSGKLNSGDAFNWSFEVLSCVDGGATIKVTKLS